MAVNHIRGKERRCALAKFLSFADELCFPTLAFPSIIKGNDTTGHSRFMALSLSLFSLLFLSVSGFQSVHTEKHAWPEVRVALVPCIIHKSDARDMSCRGCVSMRSSFIVLQIGCFNIVESANEIYQRGPRIFFANTNFYEPGLIWNLYGYFYYRLMWSTSLLSLVYIFSRFGISILRVNILLTIVYLLRGKYIISLSRFEGWRKCLHVKFYFLI